MSDQNIYIWLAAAAGYFIGVVTDIIRIIIKTFLDNQNSKKTIFEQGRLELKADIQIIFDTWKDRGLIRNVTNSFDMDFLESVMKLRQDVRITRTGLSKKTLDRIIEKTAKIIELETKIIKTRLPDGEEKISEILYELTILKL
jgi:hypothetical protein